MCGILGINRYLHDKDITIITKSLFHRGPDNNGFYRDDESTLIHTRLSIIDLSDHANQPMRVNSNIIIFNGEVYNYKELIKKYSLAPKTNSDTEAILLLYELLGDDFLNELNGMFAFCIYDTVRKEFFLARDRFGKKPLYYYWNGSIFMFSSEIKALLKILNKVPEIDRFAFEEYLSYSSPLGENTIYEGIKRLEPGCKAIYKMLENRLIISRYYDLSQKFKKSDFTEEDALNRIEELLLDSVRLRLVSDVPVASFLSGGIDSSFITKFYSLLTNDKIDAFSIGYNEHKRYDELDYARLASNFIGCNYNEVVVDKKDFIDAFEEILNLLDEPINDPAIIPTFILARFVNLNKYKVVLTGEGGDEVFLGYDIYKFISRLINDGINKVELPSFLSSEKFNLYANRVKSNDFPVYRSFGECFDNELKRRLFRYNTLSTEDQMKDWYFNYAEIGDTDWFSFIDIKHWIGEVLMTKLDRTCMMNSLEARAPFLDYRLVEFCILLPDHLRFGDTNKYLLKKIADKYLPEQIVYRRKKGFSSPYLEWYYEYYGDHILKTLSRVNRELGWFDEEVIKYLYENGIRGNLKQQLWSLIVFSRWFLKKYC